MARLSKSGCGANRVCWALIVIAAGMGAAGGSVAAATFTAELVLVPGTNQFGQYVAASYDLGVGLRNIESVRLELDVPGGYEGTIATTGNSSWYQAMIMTIQDSAVAIPAADESHFLGRGDMSVPAGSAVEIEFSRPRIFLNELMSVDGPWPEFLATGAGIVWFSDLLISSYHPLPDYEGATTTSSWTLPEELHGARLIIEADAVPEPASWGLMALSLAGMAARRRLRV
jgi:hypothetical protein